MTNNQPRGAGLMMLATAILAVGLVALPAILLVLAVIGRTPTEWASE